MQLHGRRRGFATAALLATLALLASACGASSRVIREVEARDRNGLAVGQQASSGGADNGSGQLAAADGNGVTGAGGAAASASGSGAAVGAGRRGGAPAVLAGVAA